ncbi:MAG: hypothetical protein CMK72_13770 [Pseudomonadaceae bacterium]|nr:hypothetical protein [Pseudomonadaceae bacterium]HCP55481.1 hypothetical protein [Pseudomonas sp.]
MIGSIIEACICELRLVRWDFCVLKKNQCSLQRVLAPNTFTHIACWRVLPIRVSVLQSGQVMA